MIGYHENTLHPDFSGGWYWWHRWRQPDAAVVRHFSDRSLVEWQGQQRARDAAMRVRKKVIREEKP